MATDKILNGSGLSKLSSQIKSYVNDKTEISVGATAPTDTKIKLWVDTSATGGVAWNDIIDKPDLSGYATMTEVEKKGYQTLEQVQTIATTMIQNDRNTVLQVVENKGYQTADQVNTLINQALGVIENGTY